MTNDNSTTNFAVGDRVRCINDNNVRIVIKGQTYLIAEVLLGGSTTDTVVKLQGCDLMFRASRFELVESAAATEPELFGDAWLHSVDPNSGSIRVKTKADATNGAANIHVYVNSGNVEPGYVHASFPSSAFYLEQDPEPADPRIKVVEEWLDAGYTAGIQEHHIKTLLAVLDRKKES